jgi:hypothetical protein
MAFSINIRYKSYYGVTMKGVNLRHSIYSPLNVLLLMYMYMSITTQIDTCVLFQYILVTNRTRALL